MKDVAKVLVILGAAAGIGGLAYAISAKPSNAQAAELPGRVALTQVTVTAPRNIISVGTALDLTAIATYSDGSTEDVSGSAIWVSGNPNIASLQRPGSIVGLSQGLVNIAANYYGIIGQITISVTPA